MKTLVMIGTFLLASVAWAQQKVTPVVVTNPSLTVQAADAGRDTHIGQRPSHVVNLAVVNGVASRIDPAIGLPDITPFVVPDGYVFVLTQLHGAIGCAPGSGGHYQIRQLSSVNTIRDVIHWVCPNTQDQFVTFDRHYVTGLLFGSGSQILGGTNEVVKLEGYLVPAG